MTKPSHAVARRAAELLATLLAFAGGLAGAGHLAGVDELATFGLGSRPIRPAAAVLIMLFAVALRARLQPLTLLVTIFGTMATIATTGVGWVTPSAALALLAIGAALPVLDNPGKAVGAVCTTLLLVAGVSALASLVGSVYGATPSSLGSPPIIMSVPSALALLALSCAAQLARPTRGLVGLALRDGAAGFLVGRLLPMAIVIPLALGYLRLAGQRAGLFGTEVGLTLFATSNVVTFCVLVALAARETVRHEYWRAILDGTTYAIVSTAPDGTLREINRAGERLLGAPASELIGRPLVELAAAGEHELDLRRRDGASVPVEVSVAALRDEDGVAGYVGVARDVTDLRRAADEVRQLRDALEHAVEGISRIDADGHYVAVNAAYAAAVGRTPEELVGQHWTATIAAADHERLSAEYDRMLVDGKVEADALGLRKDGSTFHRRVVMIASRAPDGSLLGHYCFSKDVTVERQAREDLVRAKETAEAAMRARADFLARMSHEIRTPMNGVIGMTRLALETELAPEQREYLEAAQTSARGLLEIIDDVLDFAKVDARRLNLEATPFGLRECLGAAVRGLAPRAHAKGLELLVDVAADVPDRVVGDPLRLAQVLVNLVGNAVKFTEAGEVVVTARARERDAGSLLLEIAVRDTGIGIASHKHAGVFEAFTQADEATTRKYGGTGLGLAIARQLVNMMGGAIGVDSAPDRGSTFWFTARLPLASPMETMSEETLATLRDVPVLVVDDHLHSRRIIVDHLTAWGLRAEGVSAAAAQAAARGAARSGRAFQLVVLDATAPISAEHFTVPAIVLTRAAGGFDAPGAAARLLKPPTPQALREAVIATLAGRAARREGAPERAGRPPMNVLLAEDNPINAKLATAVLRKAGHSVHAVSSGQAALEAFADRRFDLVLMDVQMPGKDGLETTRAIRALEVERGHARTPIIALTAQAMKGDRERCLDAGMDGYVAKPFDVETLFAEVDARVERPAAPPAPPAVDHDELLRRTGGDTVLVRDLAEMWADDAPRMLAALRSAVAAADATAVRATAHKLKGALLNIAARPAAATALELEEAGRAGTVDPGAAAARVDRLELQVRDVTSALCGSSPPRAA